MLAPEPSKPKINGAFRSVRTASILICTMAVTAFGASMTSEAATLTFGAALGNFENPATGSAGTGSALVTIDTAIPEMTVDVHFAGLGSPTTVAHIHCCVTTPDGNALVATTTPTFPGFPVNATSGDYNATFDMMLASSYNPAFITAHGGTPASAFADLLAGLIAGTAYLNIHTQQFGSGEIRGFLNETPLPAALPLFATGLVALGLLGWRRKRKQAV